MIAVDLPGGARALFTGVDEGDLGHGGVYVTEVAPDVAARRRAVVDLPWTWVRQVHGTDVVTVRSPGQGWGTAADAVVTAEPGCAVAVLTADCAPVALASPEGVLGVAHAGWAGVLAGVLERTVEAMVAMGAGAPAAVIGPCIHAECYEFGLEELRAVANRLGDDVRAVTADGRPALDLVAAARSALDRAGVSAVAEVGGCTACSPGYFSWRARRDRQRQAVVAWG